MLDMYDVQPGSLPGMWNQVEYRPLEGFVFAVTPFNFTCMNNLAFGPAILGNTVVWKPAESASLVAVACVRGAYEFQGQKCSAASRLYAPRSIWPALRDRLVDLTKSMVVGDPTEPETFVGAVINERQHAKHAKALARARAEGVVVVGGTTDASKGWFVDPTVLEVSDPHSPFITEELFAPVLTAYVYDDSDWEGTLRLVDESTPYGLTGAVFAADEHAVAEANDALRYAAGNFYVNDKPTGSVVGQQPFGGARASGTNDKAGTVWNMIRFASPRAVKRNHLAVHDYRYPHLEP